VSRLNYAHGSQAPHRSPGQHRLRTAGGDRRSARHEARHAGKGIAARQLDGGADRLPGQQGSRARRPREAQGDGVWPAAGGRRGHRGRRAARTRRQDDTVGVAVVVDANLLVVMVSGDARGPLASEQVEAWITAGEEMHAPELLPYELASALARLVAARAMSARQVQTAWENLSELPIVQHPLAEALPRVVGLALRL